MKPFSYYKTSIQFPNKCDFDEEAYNEAVNLYRDDQSRLYAEFVSDLYDDLGINGNPKADLLYEIAYDKAHSGGCDEVYYMAKSLVDLIK